MTVAMTAERAKVPNGFLGKVEKDLQALKVVSELVGFGGNLSKGLLGVNSQIVSFMSADAAAGVQHVQKMCGATRGVLSLPSAIRAACRFVGEIRDSKFVQAAGALADCISSSCSAAATFITNSVLSGRFSQISTLFRVGANGERLFSSVQEFRADRQKITDATRSYYNEKLATLALKIGKYACGILAAVAVIVAMVSAAVPAALAVGCLAAGVLGSTFGLIAEIRNAVPAWELKKVSV